MMGLLHGAGKHQGRKGAREGSRLLDQGVFQVPASWGRSRAVREGCWVLDWLPGVSTVSAQKHLPLDPSKLGYRAAGSQAASPQQP